MASFLIRSILLGCAGFALFSLWRRSRSDRFVNFAVATGFLLRAFAGQILFWISYERLPVARGLQLGNGLWFFSRDGLEYFPTAVGLAHNGIWAIVKYGSGGASVAFVKVLSIAILLFGPVTSVAVLLNLFCYLGTVAVIVSWSNREPRARTAAAFAICAISLSPAFFLWSLQPLKDTFFQFAVIAFIGACAAWQRLWTASPARIPAASFIAAAMLVTLLVIAGIRWYFAFALFIASVIFLLLIASVSQVRKAVAFTASIVLAVLLSRAFLIGGGVYVPTPIIRVLSPTTAAHEVTQVPTKIFTDIDRAREGFDRVGGRTSIQVGDSISKFDRAVHATPERVEPRSASNDTAAGPAPPVPKVAMDDAEKADGHRVDIATIHREEKSDADATKAANKIQAAQDASKSADDTKPSQAVLARAADRRPAGSASIASAEAPKQSILTQPAAPDSAANKSQAAATPRLTGAQALAGQGTVSTPSGTPKEIQQSEKTISRAQRDEPARSVSRSLKKPQLPALPRREPAPLPEAAAALPKPTPAVPVTQHVSSQPPTVEHPTSVTARLLTGAASVFIPRSIGERLGLFHIGGGQGMFWFTEIDTVVFDFALLWAIWALAVRRSLSWRNPLVWLIALLTVLAGVPLVYTITNYGTLFRLREMIYIGFALIPLALATASRRDEGAGPDPSLASS